MTEFKWFSVLIIFLAAMIGGYYPLTKRERSRSSLGLPEGESFTAGVFLALSLFIMLPAGLHLFGKNFPDTNYPLAAIFVATAFIFLLALEQFSARLKQKKEDETDLSNPAVPIIMTIIIFSNAEVSFY